MAPNEVTAILRKFARACRADEYLWGTSLPGVPTEVGAAVESAIEMIERLEATEEDRSNFLVEMGKLCAQCDALRLRIEAAEKERDNANAAAAGVALNAQKLEEDRAIDTQRMAILVAELNGAERERDALRAKVEAAEKERDDVAQQLVQSEQGKRKISKECDTYKAIYNDWIDRTEWVQQGFNEGTISAKYLGLHRADVMARLLDEAEKEREALRAKIAEMEKQEPHDAGSDVFRSAFEAALKAGNWPATRQGDGYRSPSTQFAWRIAFSTINRLKLYIAPGAKGEEK